MGKQLILLVTDADYVLEMLPNVGLSGVRLPDVAEGQQVRIVPAGPEDTATALWEELSGHGDRLGIRYGRTECDHATFTSRDIGGGMIRQTCSDCEAVTDVERPVD